MNTLEGEIQVNKIKLNSRMNGKIKIINEKAVDWVKYIWQISMWEKHVRILDYASVLM